MNFNSFDFLLFFICVWFIYIVLTKKAQNLFLVVSSLFFYGYSNLNFLALILISTLVAYASALLQEFFTHNKAKLACLTSAVLFQLFILLTFKSFHFFTHDFQEIFSSFFGKNNVDGLEVIIPLGLSFYTFQIMGYLIDVYKGEHPAERNIVSFSLFVTFFPQLLAGPIERAKDLLKQINSERSLGQEKILNGFGLICWGYTQKVVIADNLAPYYRDFFIYPGPENSIVTLLAIYLGILRVYCDFAGYCNIARGGASLLGFNLSVNFYNPLFSTGPAQLWRRWHMTLVNWFAFYVFRPLAKYLKKRLSYNFSAFIALIMTTALIGAWHGLNLKFILWGLTNGLLYLAYRFIHSSRMLRPIKIPKLIANIIWINIWGIFGLLYLANDLSDIPLHLNNLTRGLGPVDLDLWLSVVIFGGLLLVVEYGHEKSQEKYFFSDKGPLFRLSCCLFLISVIYLSGATNENPFVYFVF